MHAIDWALAYSFVAEPTIDVGKKLETPSSCIGAVSARIWATWLGPGIGRWIWS